MKRSIVLLVLLAVYVTGSEGCNKKADDSVADGATKGSEETATTPKTRFQLAQHLNSKSRDFSIPKRPEQLRVELKTGVLYVAGLPIVCDATKFDRVLKVLGKPDREYNIETARYVGYFFDRFGIIVGKRKSDESIRYVYICLTVTPGEDLDPKSAFSGVLSVDGIRITPTMTRTDLERRGWKVQSNPGFDDFFVEYQWHKLNYSPVKNSPIIERVEYDTK